MVMSAGSREVIEADLVGPLNLSIMQPDQQNVKFITALAVSFLSKHCKTQERGSRWWYQSAHAGDRRGRSN